MYFPSTTTSTTRRPRIDLIVHRPYIDLTSTLHRPHIDPTSIPCRPYTQLFFQHFFVNSETIYHYRHISIVFPPPPHLYCFSSATTTAKTFLLFSLHHHHHLLLISIVFPRKGQRGQNQTITFEFGLFEGKQ